MTSKPSRKLLINTQEEAQCGFSFPYGLHKVLLDHLS